MDLVPERVRGGIIEPRDGSCAHLGDDNRCAVYERRPGVCRVESWTAETHEACDALHLAVFGRPR